ncbi:DNA mismatch repair protein MutL, partial [Arsukibacterium sp. MJ3]|uniref:DNA mismatch repair endonuclease MutL n=1 Tax=Arsukibacterium sp. MJ3 TaxID=1632859 RepID=UPI000626EF14
VKPAAHPDGTSIEVVDLFFNTPARRKFLRSDKTEFSHIDELIKRLALSRFDVGWQLNHNGHSVRRLPQATTVSARQKRVATLCGKAFAEHAAYIENSAGAVKLHGWLLAPVACQSQATCQYSYVNGRMMRDKLLNHAIRQAYGERLNAEQQPGFVIYLDIDPAEVDVNVHPAKHEVRFHQARLVHDFVVSALSDALQQLSIAPNAALSQVANTAAPYQVVAGNSITPSRQRPDNAYPQAGSALGTENKPHRTLSWQATTPAQTARKSEGQLQYLTEQYAAADPKIALLTPAMPALLPAGNGYAIAQSEQGLVLLDLAATLAPAWLTDGNNAALLLPLRVKVTHDEKQQLLAAASLLQQLGFDILLQDSTAIIRAVAPWLRSTTISHWLLDCLPLLQPAEPVTSSKAILTMLLSSHRLSSAALLHYFALTLTNHQHWLAVPLDLSSSIAALNREQPT